MNNIARFIINQTLNVLLLLKLIKKERDLGENISITTTMNIMLMNAIVSMI
jgi:hypothetical protein